MVGNSGQQELVVEGVSISGQYYGLEDGSGFSLGQGQTREVTVGFAPQDAGNFEGVVTLVSNDARGPQTVALTGAGQWFPIAVLDPQALEFGEVASGDHSQRTLTIRNTGRASLHVTDVTAEGAGFSVEFNGGGPREFDWHFTRTDNNMSVVVNGATISGTSLVAGDYVGVFTPAASSIQKPRLQRGDGGRFPGGCGCVWRRREHGRGGRVP